MPDPTPQQQMQDLQTRIAAVEKQLAVPPSHYHNGFDSNQIAWADLYQKKLYVHWSLTGSFANDSSNYDVFFIIPAPCLLTRAQEVHRALGTNGGAVTCDIEKLTTGVAPDSGVVTLTSPFDLKASINVPRTATITLTNANRTFVAGDRLCMKDAGTLTSVLGVSILIELQLI